MKRSTDKPTDHLISNEGQSPTMVRPEATKTGKSKGPAFTLDEIKVLLKEAPPEWRDFLEAVLTKPIRVGALVRLRWGDLPSVDTVSRKREQNRRNCDPSHPTA